MEDHNKAIFEIQANFCKAMANPAHLQILHLLRYQPMTVGEIVHASRNNQPMISVNWPSCVL